MGFYGDGWLRIVDSTGSIVADRVDPRTYQDFLGEAVEPWTYLKFPYYKPVGYPDGIYRVGPLARLNIVNQCGTAAGRPGTGRIPQPGARTPCSARSTTTMRG